MVPFIKTNRFIIYPLLKGFGSPQITHDFSHFRPDPNGQPGHSMSKRRTPKPERCANCGWAFISSCPTSKEMARSEMCRLFFSPVSTWWFCCPRKNETTNEMLTSFDEVKADLRFFFQIDACPKGEHHSSWVYYLVNPNQENLWFLLFESSSC